MNEYNGVPKNGCKRLENFHVINLSIFVLLKTRSKFWNLTALGEERYSVFRLTYFLVSLY